MSEFARECMSVCQALCLAGSGSQSDPVGIFPPGPWESENQGVILTVLFGRDEKGQGAGTGELGAQRWASFWCPGEPPYSGTLLEPPCPAGSEPSAHGGLRARASTCRRSPGRGLRPRASRVSCFWRCAVGEQFPLSPSLQEKALDETGGRSRRGRETWAPRDPETSPFPGP